MVAARFNISGTHLGEFQGIKPGGKKVRISAMNLYRLKSGKVVKEFNQFDNLSLLWQIGVYPPHAPRPQPLVPKHRKRRNPDRLHRYRRELADLAGCV